MVNKRNSIVCTETFFSKDDKHRYLVKKWWCDGEEANYATAIMLNPSFTNELKCDKTTNMLMNFFVDRGYNGFYLVNLFSIISSNEKEMKKHPCKDRYNKETDKYIKKAINNSKDVYFGWGSNKNKKRRITQILNYLKEHDNINFYVFKEGNEHTKKDENNKNFGKSIHVSLISKLDVEKIVINKSEK